jgi:hypothetical protein
MYHRATQALRNHTSKPSEIKHGGEALLVSGQQVFETELLFGLRKWQW